MNAIKSFQYHWVFIISQRIDYFISYDQWLGLNKFKNKVNSLHRVYDRLGEMVMRIMVVDDEEDVQILFKQRFRKEIKSGTIEFKFEFSGESALDYLKKEGEANISQIFSGINMPG